jgi:hypothetical protein
LNIGLRYDLWVPPHDNLNNSETLNWSANPPTLESIHESPSDDPLTLAVTRSFPTPFEGQHLDFRVEAFDALNHPEFAAPGSTLGGGNFGAVTTTNTDNRELRWP